MPHGSPATTKNKAMPYELAPVSLDARHNHMASMRVLPEYVQGKTSDLLNSRHVSQSPDTAMPINKSSLYGGDFQRETTKETSLKYHMDSQLPSGEKKDRLDTFENKLDLLEKMGSPENWKKKNPQIEADFWDVPEMINQQVTIDPKDFEEKKKEPKIVDQKSLIPEIGSTEKTSK